MASEQHRIAFLNHRDGQDKARTWVERTLHIYTDAIDTPASHASLPEYRPRFEAAIEEFRAWLSTQPPGNPAE